jgi:hypothetical protein
MTNNRFKFESGGSSRGRGLPPLPPTFWHVGVLPVSLPRALHIKRPSYRRTATRTLDPRGRPIH